MPRKCTVCSHDERNAIDQGIIDGRSFRHLARRYSVSKDALWRHARNHLPDTLKQAGAAKELTRANSLLRRIEKLTGQAEELLLYGKTGKQGREWAAGLRELRKSIELLARVSGELDDRPVVNIVSLPQWVELRTLILTAIEPYPLAREAVVEVLSADSD